MRTQDTGPVRGGIDEPLLLTAGGRAERLNPIGDENIFSQLFPCKEAEMAQLSHLERQLDELDASFSQLGRANLSETLRVIMRRPGWTTPAESHLVSGVLEALQLQVNAISTQSKRLVSAAEQVGGEQSAVGGAESLAVGAITRRLWHLLKASDGDKSSFCKKTLEEMVSKSLITDHEARQFKPILEIAFSSEANRDTPSEIRRACQDMIDPDSSPVAAAMADGMSHAMLLIDDAIRGGIVDETKITPKNVAVTVGTAIVGAVAGAAVGGVVGAVLGGIAGAVAGFLMSL
jgi:hypothetical protein